MKTIFANTIKTLAVSLLLAASIHSAQATALQTYVSRSGSNAGTCDSSPCATFQYALSQTSAGGVVTAVDAGNYGPLYITQSVTIDGSGTQANIIIASGDAISISGATTDTIILRHLSLTGLTGAYNGIAENTGNLVMDDCKISGFTVAFGIAINGSGKSVVQNTTVTGCGTGLNNGGMGQVSLRNVTLQGNINGLVSENGVVDISHSLISQNSQFGVSSVSSGVTVSVSDCMISGNNTAIYALNSSTIRLSNNDIFNNGAGIFTNGGGSMGIVATAGNNRKAGNTSPGAPTPGKIITVQ